MVEEFKPTFEAIHQIWLLIKDSTYADQAFSLYLDEKSEVTLVRWLQQKDSAAAYDRDVGFLVFATNIVPRQQCFVHILSWKPRTDKVEGSRQAIALFLFKKHGLQKIYASIPESGRAARLFARRIGMKLEGILENGYIMKDGRKEDVYVFGLSRKEFLGG